VSFGCVSEGFKLLKSCRFSVAGILVFSSSRSREDPCERDELIVLKENSFYANVRPRSRTRSFGGFPFANVGLVSRTRRLMAWSRARETYTYANATTWTRTQKLEELLLRECEPSSVNAKVCQT